MSLLPPATTYHFATTATTVLHTLQLYTEPTISRRFLWTEHYPARVFWSTTAAPTIRIWHKYYRLQHPRPMIMAIGHVHATPYGCTLHIQWDYLCIVKAWAIAASILALLLVSLTLAMLGWDLQLPIGTSMLGRIIGMLGLIGVIVGWCMRQTVLAIKGDGQQLHMFLQDVVHRLPQVQAI